MRTQEKERKTKLQVAEMAYQLIGVSNRQFPADKKHFHMQETYKLDMRAIPGKENQRQLNICRKTGKMKQAAELKSKS
jgi:hypothetical protein